MSTDIDKLKALLSQTIAEVASKKRAITTIHSVLSDPAMKRIMTAKERDERNTEKERLITILAEAKARQAAIISALERARTDAKLTQGFTAPRNLHAQAARKIQELQQALFPGQINDEWPEDTLSLYLALIDASRENVEAQLATARATIETQARDIARLQSTRAPVIHREPSHLGCDILGELWTERYEEIDKFRRNRGIRWRLHVTEDQARRIADILGE